MKYSGVYIIYNPNSTGDSEAMAKELKQQLSKHMKEVKIELVATKRAGHAEELATMFAKKEKSPLIISSSGDGGYNEVVNGVMKSGNKQAICAVLPAGNANDHARTMQDRSLEERILAGKTTSLDLIKVRIETSERYAHSYVGLGLTPVVATELNRHTLNAFRETWLALKTFFKYQPFKIEHDGKIIRLDSLLFANINQMAKMLTLAPENRPDDGKFEVVLFPAGRKWKLVKRLAQAATTKLDTPVREEEYQFTVIKKMPMQLDGEVMTLKKGDEVTVTSAHKALKTIV